MQELDNGKIVVVAGFQGINGKEDITTLGRGGSDTTAVAIAAAIQAKHCYIFSDVDGVYTTDPNKVTIAKKLDSLSYEEMLDISHEGAKVLHNRCIEVGKKYNIPIITKSTFNNKPGSVISNLNKKNEIANNIKYPENADKIESCCVKSIVKNDTNIYAKMLVPLQEYDFTQIVNLLLENNITANHFLTKNREGGKAEISFTIPSTDLMKLQTIFENAWSEYETQYKPITRIAIVGQGIQNDVNILKTILNIVSDNNLNVTNLEITEYKIAIMFDKQLENTILEQLHEKLI